MFVLMLMQSMCIPIPSEATLLATGFDTTKPGASFTYVVAVIAAVAGDVLGACVAWWIGRIGRVDLLDKYGSKVGIRTHHLEVADRWFQRHGEATVFFGKMLPIVRTFIALPAGISKMPFWKFLTYTTLGSIPWVLALTFAGVQAGENWTEIKKYLEYGDYLVAAVIIGGLIWLAVRSRGKSNSEPGSDAPAN